MCSVHIIHTRSSRCVVLLLLLVLELLSMTLMTIIAAQLLVSVESLTTITATLHNGLVILLNVIFRCGFAVSIVVV